MKLMKHIWIIAGLSFLVSCSDFLEERSQDTYYITSYTDLDELLIGDCYLSVNPASELVYTTDPGYFIHYLADEIEEHTNGELSYTSTQECNEAIFGYYTWQQRVGQTYNYNGYLSENLTWKEIYRLINVANNIIDCTKNVPQETEEEKLEVRRVNGEAHFLRAAYYFWLVNLYGKPYTKATADTDLGVPVKISSEVNDVIFSRSTVQEVYNLVLSDLKQAEADLTVSRKLETIYRADITAVHLLMSRVYLYMQDWTMAKKYADKVLETHSELVDLHTLNGSFLTKSSVENIFSMGGAEIPCSMCNYDPSFRVSHDLYDAYDDNDLRKNAFWWKRGNFVGYVKLEVPPMDYDTDPDDKYYYEEMFYLPSRNMKASVSDRFLFRTAEAYLNKAEAEAYLGNESDARDALNDLYVKRYEQGNGYDCSGEDLVKAIRKERRLELALEGHRWFDLRRYSVCEKYPESKRIVHEYTYYEDYNMVERHRFVLEEFDAAYTLPIPQEVIEFNVGMPNNERPVRNHTVVPIE